MKTDFAIFCYGMCMTTTLAGISLAALNKDFVSTIIGWVFSVSGFFGILFFGGKLDKAFKLGLMPENLP